ncbi:hypothetical protein JHK85_007712 [Glycine max]|nr:hypothetical protein JHK85_007712 [Glycine max]
MMVKAIQLQICGLVSQRWSWKPRTVSSLSSFSSIPYPNPYSKLLPITTVARWVRFVPFHASSSSLPSAGNVRNIKFCQWCGGSTKHDIPEGEERLRAICTLILWFLFTLKFWIRTSKSAVEGAIRETREEANADVEVISPFAQLDIPLIGQSYMIFLAKLKKHHFSPGPESSACQLFPLDDIPFNSLSFSSMVVTLSLAGYKSFRYSCLYTGSPYAFMSRDKQVVAVTEERLRLVLQSALEL